MKRIFSCLMAALLLVFLTACGGGSPEPPTDGAPEEGAYLLDGSEAGGTEDDGYVPDDGPADLPEASPENAPADNRGSDEAPLPENGSYTTRDDVALYLHTYGRLPDNFISKKDAQALGWSGGSLEPYAPGMCIGGSHFGNYEGLLPDAEGRSYTECDIDTLGADSRGAKRIVFSNDGLIYYTEDHYKSFTLLYGEA